VAPTVDLADPATPPVLRRIVKRTVDITVAVVSLVVLAPILLAAALAVKLTSPGPVVFAQHRVGRDERHFTAYKLRTMVVDQDRVLDLAAVERAARAGVLTKLTDDPRVTPVGKVLRRTSIDELPQLFNVVKGDMSLVGPRPLVPFMLAPFPDLSRQRSVVRPGLTGLWQVSDRGANTTALDMAELDLRYVRSLRLRLDLRILLATIPACIRGSGAM
jgi:lipopolysaccharide/colanic/teichoic acid biosynthesis glycosyltransferase